MNIGGTLSVTQADAPKDEQYAGDSQPKLTVSGADEVYLITVTGRDYNMGELSAFASQSGCALIDSLYNRTTDFARKYSAEGKFSYSDALDAHLAVYQPQFNAVTLTLKDGSSENRTKSC